ncbi:MAG: arsenate reductase (glutaredoxin) [Rhizomicrobium sp.]
MVTIYHNPHCSNSRRALEVIRAAGIEPDIVEYLKTPLSEDGLRQLVARTGQALRALVRDKEPLFAELGLADASEAELFAAVAAHPVLLNRPIVVTDKGTKLCRPGDQAAALL